MARGLHGVGTFVQGVYRRLALFGAPSYLSYIVRHSTLLTKMAQLDFADTVFNWLVDYLKATNTALSSKV